MRWSSVAAVGSCLPLAWSCSYVEIPFPSKAGSNGTAFMIGRTMELGNLFGKMSYVIETVPTHVSGGKYGYVAPMNVCGYPHLNTKVANEGMNEVGLTISALAFDQSAYEAPLAGSTEIAPEDVVANILAQCDSVDSALDYLASVRVVAKSVLDKMQVLHWAIHEPSGRSVVVEYLEGRRVIYENAPRVLTNDPDLTWQWRNLNTYSNLNPTFPHQNDFLQVEAGHGVGSVPRAVGHGWNLFGMPGDSSPPSRFARLFYLRGYALNTQKMTDESDAVVLGTALLNNVFIPYGVVPPDPKKVPGVDRPEYTPYGILKVPAEKKILLRAYRNSQWRLIDLNRVDFSKAQSWPLEDGSLGIEDITANGRAMEADSADFGQAVV